MDAGWLGASPKSREILLDNLLRFFNMPNYRVSDEDCAGFLIADFFVLLFVVAQVIFRRIYRYLVLCAREEECLISLFWSDELG